ncbi:MAG: sulfotransferase family 2 domain-containing protein [Rhizomicrobium sp.]|jgi:hypothetical protein
MTIVSVSHGFIFVHVPKTAGTSLKRYLRPFEREGDVHIEVAREAVRANFALRKHCSVAEIRQQLGEERFASLFKFSAVRNPFDRTLSTFLFLKFNFRDWDSSEQMDAFDSLESFVSSDLFGRSGPGRIFLPQSSWLTDAAGKLTTDAIIKMESLESDMAVVLKTLGLNRPSRAIPERNQSKANRAPFGAELSKGAVVDAIRQRYANDFEMFNYQMSPDRSLMV